MKSRYAPYIDWESRVDLSGLKEGGEPSWKLAAEVRAAGIEEAPLAGLKLALDPGHIGGEWAEHEGRHFRIKETDHFVREGELVLEVAQRAAERLRAYGAVVVLLRENHEPVNPQQPTDYVERVIERNAYPADSSLAALADHAITIRDQAIRESIVVGELVERARLINEEIQPDAALSLHMNAAPWPVVDGAPQLQLVKDNHLHFLIFGCLSEREISAPHQLKQLERKLANRSGPEEQALAHSLAEAFAFETGLAPSSYSGTNAVLLDPEQPYVWARNLMLLRMVECPVVLLEPYIANSETVYLRLQSALENRANGVELAEDDILLEYTEAVVMGVLSHYAMSESQDI